MTAETIGSSLIKTALVASLVVPFVLPGRERQAAKPSPSNLVQTPSSTSINTVQPVRLQGASLSRGNRSVETAVLAAPSGVALVWHDSEHY